MISRKADSLPACARAAIRASSNSSGFCQEAEHARAMGSHRQRGLPGRSSTSLDATRQRNVPGHAGRGMICAHAMRPPHLCHFHLAVPGEMSVSEAHRICDRIERALKAKVEDALSLARAPASTCRAISGSSPVHPLWGAVFALASATIDITTARPEAVAAGMRITFAVAAMLIVVALAIAVGSRALTTRPSLSEVVS